MFRAKSKIKRGGKANGVKFPKTNDGKIRIG